MRLVRWLGKRKVVGHTNNTTQWDALDSRVETVDAGNKLGRDLILGELVQMVVQMRELVLLRKTWS